MRLVEQATLGRIGYIILNRPDKKNALSWELIDELKKAFLEAEANPGIKVIVLKANGNVFCAGADLSSLHKLQTNSYLENLEDSNHLKELFQLIYSLKKVVIAQINGHALAGGCGLASVCDFSFAVPHAKFGYTEVKIGFVPALVSTFLIRKIGEAKARELLLSGSLIDARKAKEISLITDFAPEQELENTVIDFAENLCIKNSGQSMEAVKMLMAKVQEMGLEEALSYSAEINAKSRASEDCKRGISAFLNKEDLTW